MLKVAEKIPDYAALYSGYGHAKHKSPGRFFSVIFFARTIKVTRSSRSETNAWLHVLNNQGNIASITHSALPTQNMTLHNKHLETPQNILI